MGYDGLTKIQEDTCYAYVFITDFDLESAMKIGGYDWASDKDIMNMKRDFMRNPKTRARIADLIHEREEDDLIDKAFIIEKLKKVIKETDKGNYNAHLKAIELLGKHLGMFNEKQPGAEDKDPAIAAKELYEKRKATILKIKKKVGDSDGANENRPMQANSQ